MSAFDSTPQPVGVNPVETVGDAQPIGTTELHAVWKIDNFLALDPLELRKQLQKSNLPIDKFWGKANSFIEVRGRNPSKGWLLVTGKTLASLNNPQHPEHTIEVTDGQRTYKRSGLLISHATCVSPSAQDGTYTFKTDGEPDHNAAYLIEIADARYYASWGTLQLNINLRDPECGFEYPDEGRNTWPHTLLEMWRVGMPRIMGPLLLDNKTPWPALGPESLRWSGANTWDALHEVLENIGRVIGPSFTNPRGGFVVWGLTHNTWLSQKEKQSLDVAISSALIDTDGSPVHPHIPHYIRVYFPSRDHQWWKNAPASKTPQDFVRDFPTRYVDYPTEQFINNEAKEKACIISGTIKHVWATLPYMTDDDNRVCKPFALWSHGQSLARETTESLLLHQRFRGWTFSGVWPFFKVGPVFSGVAFYDLGDGLKTRLFTRPKHFDPDTNLSSYNESAHRGKHPDEDWVGPPDTLRHRQPYFREGYGVVLPFSPSQQVLAATLNGDANEGFTVPCFYPPIRPDQPHTFDAVLPATDNGDTDPIPTGLPVQVALLASRIEDGRQIWFPVTTVEAYATSGVPPDSGSRVVLRWNPQPGPCGVWQIISVGGGSGGGGGSSLDIQQDCVSTREVKFLDETTEWRTRTPSLLTVRRNSSLRLLGREDPMHGLCEPILDIAPGPASMIFQSRGKGCPPRWSGEPSILGSLHLGQWILFEPDTTTYSPGTASGLGPPSVGQGGMLRLPDNNWESQAGSFLIAGETNGGCIQSRWFGPGINTIVSFEHGHGGPYCSGSFSQCITMYFVNGLLMNLHGAPFTTPEESYDVECIVTPAGDHLPCPDDFDYEDECNPPPEP